MGEEKSKVNMYQHSCDENGECIMKMPPQETDRLTLSGIYLVINVDGVHKEKELIGYIDEHPFVVLHQLLPKYYISGYYDNDLYPIFMAGFKYSIFIKNEGDSYNYDNIYKPKIKDIDAFCARHTKMNLAEVDNKYSDEYMNLLGMATKSNPDLQEAIDLQGYCIMWDKLADYSDIDTDNQNKLLLQAYKVSQMFDTLIGF